MQVHLVDGTYELFRCFHGAPRATGPDGREVGAGRAVLATLAALLAEDDVTHVAVTFDKLVAPRDPDPLSQQVPLAVDVVRALGLTVWPSAIILTASPGCPVGVCARLPPFPRSVSAGRRGRRRALARPGRRRPR